MKHVVKQCTTCERTNFYKNTNHSRISNCLKYFGHVIYSLQTWMYLNIAKSHDDLIGWGGKIRVSAKRWDSPNECPEHDTKQSDGEASVMLELWGMRSTPSLTSLPGLLWLGVVVLDRVQSMGQIELFSFQNWVQINDLFIIE